MSRALTLLLLILCLTGFTSERLKKEKIPGAFSQTAPPDTGTGMLIINDSSTSTGSFFFNVKDLGATGNGIDDDSGPIQTALTAAGGSSHGVVYLPEGRYLLKEPVTWSRLSGERGLSGIVIRGDGIGRTIIIVDNDTGGIILDDFYNQTQYQVRDLTFLAGRPGAGTAVTAGKYGNRMGGRGYRCFTGENIEIKGQNPEDYFNKGLDVRSLYRPLLRDIAFTGATGSGDEYRAIAGISVDWCYSPEVENCRVEHAEIGFSCVSIVPEGEQFRPESGTFHRCVTDNCIIGIDIEKPGNMPGFSIKNCRLRTKYSGLRTKGIKFHQVQSNIFEPLMDPAVHEYKDIITMSCFMGVYHRNIFLKYAGGKSEEDLRTCFSFDGSDRDNPSSDMIITDNVFPETGNDFGGDEYGSLLNSLLKNNHYTDTLEAGTVQKRIDRNHFEPLRPVEMELTGPVFSVLDYGATENDWNDDAAAFQAAADALTAHGKGILYIPAGMFLANQPIEFDIPALTIKGTIAIHGEGPGVSMVICNNQEGVFSITDHSGKTAFDLKDFGIYANKNNATGIYLESKAVDKPGYRTLKVRNVDIQPYEETFSQHITFRNGLLALNFSKPYFYNYLFNSYDDPNYDMPFNEMPEYGVYLEGCDNVTFIYSYSWQSKYAYYIVSETCNDAYFYRTRGVSGFHGIYMVMIKPSSRLRIESCHVNKTLSNIYLENMTDFILIDNLPYGPADENKLNDIELINCRDGQIIGNVFQAAVIENYRPDPVSSRNSVVIRGERSANIEVEMNIFNAKGRALLMDEGIEGVVTMDNLYPNPEVVKPALK